MTIDGSSERFAREHADAALTHRERARYVDAAERAMRAYPGALGELVHRELAAFAEFGFRLDGEGLVPRLAAEVLADLPDVPDGAGRTS